MARSTRSKTTLEGTGIRRRILSHLLRIPIPKRTEKPCKERTYKVSRTLFTSGEAVVEKAKHRKTGQLVAIKSFHAGHDRHHKRETQVLTALQGHERIVRLIESLAGVADTEPPRLVLEFADRGDLCTLGSRHAERKVRMAEPLLWHLFGQLVEAVAWMHEGVGAANGDRWRPVIHQDIKPENVLLCSRRDRFPDVKLADFGLSKFADVENLFEPEAGTWGWKGKDEHLGTKQADIWAVGAVVCFLATGSDPLLCGPPLPSTAHTHLESECVCFQPLYARNGTREYTPRLLRWVQRATHPDPALRACCREMMGMVPVARQKALEGSFKLQEWMFSTPQSKPDGGARKTFEEAVGKDEQGDDVEVARVDSHATALERLREHASLQVWRTV